MRYIEVPPDVILLGSTGEPMVDESGQPHGPFSMRKWILGYIAADPEIAEDGRKGLRAVRAIRKAFIDTIPGEIVQLEDDPWERCKAIVEKQTYARKIMNPAALAQFWDFMEAILEAKDKPQLQQVEASNAG